MIRLNPEQMLALQDASMHRFLGRVIDELPGYRGALVAGRSRSVLFRSASLAVDHAQEFGLESERSLFLFANLAVTLGAYFPGDPALPWAGEILTDTSYFGNEKMDDLWNAYIDYCEQVMGPEPQAYFPAAVYRRFQDMPAPPAENGALTAIVDDLTRLWPEKASALSTSALRAHIAATGKRAHDLGFTDHETMVRFGRIAFILGHGFDADPLHDWVAQLLPGAGTGYSHASMAKLEAGFAREVIAPALAWSDSSED